MAPLFLHQQNVSSLLADKEKRAGAADMNISVFNLAIKFSECFLCSVGSLDALGVTVRMHLVALKYRENICIYSLSPNPALRCMGV